MNTMRPLTPAGAAVVQRLLQKSQRGSGINMVAAYCTALSITDFSLKTMPGCLDPNSAPEWNAFLRADNKHTVTDPARNALRAVLSFLEYAKTLRIDVLSPHFRFRDPVTGNAVIDLGKIDKVLLAYDMKVVFASIKAAVTKLQLARWMTVHKTKTTVTKAASVSKSPLLVTTWALKTKTPKMTLDAALSFMSGFLYSTNVPPQLQAVTQGGKGDKNPPFDTLLTGVGTVGWYPIIRNPIFQLYAIRAKSGILVLKAIVPTSVFAVDDVKRNAELIRLWSKFKIM